MTSSKIKGTPAVQLSKPLSALYYTVVVVYGNYTLGYSCHVPLALLYPWIQAV